MSFNNAITKMMNLFCAKCNEVFAIPARRGRPPKYCSGCMTVVSSTGLEDQQHRDADRVRANLRIDNLEMMLRSRGTHISQHTKDW